MSDSIPRSYEEFWPYYLRQHANPRTRQWHIAGTGAASALALAAVVTISPALLIGALVAGYGPAWLAHFFVEKNRPATWRFPLWSLASDFRMAGLWVNGGLPRELEKAGIQPDPADGELTHS
jgi:hypothetical protein